ncbi:Cof-type HAD-IIB family hydrolase [Weissella viridescens]|uniref:Cof-type HAD-IIB family hydrolase n=1 Tax=Weissella viridescens TaxID=1629 RepID=UPI001C7D3388|nr:HAD family hydrolase [Weissella viridescens]MBX4173229.1 Cof-type HAD-IIB family hydrolase [Weissella viridescens]
MAIRLIATDMDGTLLNDDKKFNTERMQQLLKQMQAQDIRFVAASGNQRAKLESYFEPVGADQVTYISDNGAVVTSQDTIIAEQALSREQVQAVLEWNAKHFSVQDNLILISGVNGAYVSNHATPELMKMLHFFFHNLYQVEKFSDIEDDILRVSLIWEQDADVNPHIESLKTEFEGEMHVTGSGFGMVDILAPNVNKRTGLEALAKKWHLTPAEMVAIGDNANDLEMLNYVGHPFVMPNAEPFMHEAISETALADNNHDGVLDTIEAILKGDLA